jgi:hypothetical protein
MLTRMTKTQKIKTTHIPFNWRMLSELCFSPTMECENEETTAAFQSVGGF